MSRVIVVGGGLAGLATAARLAKLKHEVTLCEQSSLLGGALRSARTTTLPAALRDLFRKSGRPLEKELDLVAVETPRRHLFGDGTVLDLPLTSRSDQRDALATAFDPATADAWTALLDGLAPTWEVIRTRALESVYKGVGLRGWWRLQPWRSFEQLAAETFPSEPQARSLLAATALGSHADLRRTPGFLAVQAYVERTFGRWSCAAGGLAPLVDVLARRLEERKVRVLLETRVSRIEVSGGAVTGVLLSDDSPLPADIVVAAVPADPLLWDPPSALRAPMEKAPPLHVVPGGPDEPFFEVVHHDRTPTSSREAASWAMAWDGASAFGRLAPTRTEVRGLYCAGATARPGPGVPYVLLGAALVAAEVGST